MAPPSQDQQSIMCLIAYVQLSILQISGKIYIIIIMPESKTKPYSESWILVPYEGGVGNHISGHYQALRKNLFFYFLVIDIKFERFI